MKKSFRKTLAYLLSVLLIFTSLPLIAAAEDAITQNEEKTAVSEPHIIAELNEKRESNIKHFQMSDGSIKAAVYSYDVHFTNENNDFTDIDNSLKEETVEEEKVYSNKSNIVSVKFKKKSNPNKLYTINKGNYKIKVAVEGVSKVSGKVESFEDDILAKKQFALKNIGSKITYSDILENTDFEYILFSTELKENIILKEKVDYNSLIYSYDFNGKVNAVQENDKNIVVYESNNDNLIFNISAPAIWDSAGNYYDNISIELLENKNSKIKVKLNWEIDDNAIYPVTVDPVMKFQYERTNIQDTHIISSYPTTNYDVNNHIRVRNDGYALLKFPLPSLKSGDKIVNAQFSLFPYGYFDNSLDIYSNANSFDPKLYITAHKILKTWNETTATYQNINPDNGFYESTAQSYHVVGSNNSFYTWDITRLANDWTEGRATNYGVLLKYAAPPSNGSTFDSFFCSTNGKFIDSVAWPQIVYQYINTTGIEDYFSYHIQDAGRAGKIHTNDLTGNLTLINPLLQTGGSLTSIGVSLVYNTNDVGNSAAPYGKGWSLNWSQKIDRTIESDFGYTIARYIDSDGTSHYFSYNSSTGVFTDEINSKRKIIWLDTSNYLLEDESGISMRFVRYGTDKIWYLSKVSDQYGNYIQINRNSSNYNRIDKIISSGGNTVDFVYNSGGYLTTLKYYDGDTTKQITIQYNGTNNSVNNIIFADGKNVGYLYYNSTSYLTRATDIDGYNWQYTYNGSTTFRVSSITEATADGVIGAKTTASYYPTSTIFIDTVNNRKYLYSFSANGTLKSTINITDDENSNYSQYYEYNNDNTTQMRGMSNLTFESKVQKSTVNLLSNHSFEKSNLPSFQVWYSSATTHTGGASTEEAFMGNTSYKLYCPADSPQSRTVAFYRVDLQAGKKYTFSAYANTKDMVSQGKGVNLVVLTTGEYQNSEYLTSSKDEWQRLSLTFVAPATETVSVCLTMDCATGSAYFDCVQFEEGDLSEYNILENAGFEKWTNSSIDSWARAAGTAISSNEALAGNLSLKLSGNITKANEYQQWFAVPNGKAGDTYVGSAYAKAISAPAENNMFTIMITFTYGSSSIKEKFLFDSYITDWQHLTFEVKAPQDYTGIGLSLLYTFNCNTVYFDNAQLIRDNFGTSYTYDANGNLISTVDLENKESNTFQYDGNNQLIKQTNVGGGEIDYVYDTAKKQQLNSVSSGGVKTDYTYDSFGNAVTSTTYGENTEQTPKITSSATYSTNGEYLTSITDSLGKTESYQYNEDRGYLKSSTNAKGITTNYEYYPSELLKKVTSGNSTVNYSYDTNNRLQTITSPSGTSYGFTYDAFGRTDTIKVGTRPLSDYTYNSKGLLTNMAYGNGTNISYGYDSLNRQTSISINDTLRYKFVYDGSSRVNIIEDILAGKQRKFAYDILERPVWERIIDKSTNKITAELGIRYDNSKNRVAGYDVNIEGLSKTTDFVYGELTRAPEVITGVNQNGTRMLTYGYDSLNRLSSRTLATRTPFVTEYTYIQGASSDKTTALVASIKNGDDTISYTYDNLGNIRTIEWGGSTYAEYTYDSLNQLIAVNDAFGDDYTYTYDNNGNILTAKYNDTVTKTYTYGNSEWKDLLTAYNGQAITYDNIGNPLSYRDGMSFTWADGRKLSTVTKGTDNISYTYDANGLRTSKNVNGVTTEYYWLNGVLQAQKSEGLYLIFLYDENNSPYGFITARDGSSGSCYYYVFNVQGDVIGLVDQYSNPVVQYQYNEWGKLISMSGIFADGLGDLNPIRYRGYFYDEETGFYYLQSRYYDPEIMRFINADSLIDNRGIITQNLFQYCGNNPVNNADPSGNLFGAIVGIGLLVIGMVATLSGCSSKPAATTSTPSTPSKPSTPSSSTSSTTPPHIPTPQEKSYAATVYAEAGGQNKRSKQAVAHVMNNRIGTRSSWTDIEAVISAPYQFEGYNSPMYRAAMDYYDKGICDNSIDQSAMDECLAVVIPIYSGAEADITGGALYFHSFPNPSDWPYHNSLTQVYVSGTEKFWFYK